MTTKPLKYRALPLVYLRNQLTPERVSKIVSSIKKFQRFEIAAVALIVNIPGQRAVQIDKLAQMLLQSSQKYNYPIYGFTQSTVSPQSYYMLSISNKIFSSPSTLFTFKRQIMHYSFEPLFQKLGLKYFRMKNHQKVLGRYYDPFISPEMGQYGNQKPTDIDLKLLKYSLANRCKRVQKLQNMKIEDIDAQLIGKEAIQQGFIDEFASYQEILKNQFQDARILKINRQPQVFSIFTFLFFISSPILLMIFLFKVFLKYSILMYVWIKAMATGRGMSEIVKDEQLQLNEFETQWIKQYEQNIEKQKEQKENVE